MIYFHIIPILKWPLIPTSLLSYVESFFNDPNPIEKGGPRDESWIVGSMRLIFDYDLNFNHICIPKNLDNGFGEVF